MLNDKTTDTFHLSVYVFLLLFMLNCSTTRKNAVIEWYDFEIHFGSTGGFTNTNPVYIVKSTGEVMKKVNSSSDLYQFKKISKHKINSFYLLLEQSNFCNLKIKQISNFTYYIEIKSEKCNNKVWWFDDSQIPVEVKELFISLSGVIKK